MFDTLLHTGTDHPQLLWILVPSYLTFMIGIAVGMYSDRVREFINAWNTKTTE